MSYYSTNVNPGFTVQVNTKPHRIEPTANKNAAFDNLALLKQIKQGDISNAAAFTGFGGLRQFLSLPQTQQYLSQFLSNDEITSLMKSTSTGYFTPNLLIDFIYAIIQKLGFHSGKILEPACGHGAFFERMPEEMRKNSQITGIELETVSAKIATQLYPDVTIINQGFQLFHDNNFDLILGNPPYASFSVFDEKHPDLKDQAIHHYFVAKCVRLLKQGGLLAMVLPSYVLDNIKYHARKEIADYAELIMAYRMPNDLFLNAKVTVDIAIFQRKINPNKDWIKTETIKLNNNKIFPLSSYFVRHPGHIIGVLDHYETWNTSENKMRIGLRCVGSKDDVKKRMATLIERIAPLNESIKITTHEVSKIADEKVSVLSIDKVSDLLEKLSHNLQMLKTHLDMISNQTPYPK